MYKNISSIMGSAMVSRIVNVKVAKGISCVLIVLILVINSLTYIDSGVDPCRGILTSGSFLDVEVGVWQPHGCMLHRYKTEDTKICLRNKKIAFVGDSRMRELMFSFVRILKPSYEPPEEMMHSDILLKESDVNMQFHWVPELNGTMAKLYKSWLDNPEGSPDFIFQASATHTMKRSNGSEKAFEEYTKNFTSLIPTLHMLNKKRGNRMFWIYQEPVNEEKLSPVRKMLTNERLEQYNQAVEDILDKSDPESIVGSISVFKHIAERVMDQSPDGLHLPPKALKIESNILVNYLCNNKIQPIDGTCCQSAPDVTAVQLLLLLLGLSCIIGVVVLKYIKYKKPNLAETDAETGDVVRNGQVGASESTEALLPSQKPVAKPAKKEKTKMENMEELITALAKFSLIMLYFYVCDRTNLFMKGNKHFTNAHFFLPLLYVTLLGIFGIVQTSQTAFLNRDQTDEWKGWMQLVILIYHMSGASVNIPIYMHIRILVAMYLFMTGYGHFSYFWNKGDYGLYRVCNVVFRLNFLTVALCLVMDRSYQFYYFVPLCTFWFLILYISMAMWPRANVKMMSNSNGSTSPDVTQNGTEKNYPLRDLNLKSPFAIMTLKLILVFLGISVLFVSESYYEALFSWWPAIRIFELPVGSVREWWFRCQLDRYAMLHGAVLCFIYLILKKLKYLDDSKQGCLLSTKASFITMTLSIVTVITYILWVLQCTDKPSCNRVHSFASLLPITAFIIIRNVPGYLRSGYSAFFGWFGKISLELFIGQYHIWLAADTKGMLVLVSPEWPTLNLVVTSFIFVCIAHEINIVTGVVTRHIVGSPTDNTFKVLLRVMSILATICVISFIQNTFNPLKAGMT